MPQYLAYMVAGAISPDMTGLRLSERDEAEYRFAVAKRRETQHG